MATSDIDVIVNVYETTQRNRVIGVTSPYANEPHPGTSQKISGWLWSRKYWPTLKDFKGLQFAPTVYDGSTSGLQSEYFQSGYGDNNDTALINIKDVNLNDVTIWSPTVNHGFYYIQDEQWYLFSDSYQTHTFSGAVTISGMQYLDLQYNPKPTIPIYVRQYRLNPDLDRHVAHLDFRKRIEFSDSPTGPEFVLDMDHTPPRIWLDGDYSEEIGVDISLTASGTAVDPSEFDELEMLGRANGEKDQVFDTMYSPIDPWAPVEVWTYQDEYLPRQWTVISGYETFDEGTYDYEVHVDYDTGRVTFGNYDYLSFDGGGRPPARGNKVFIRYTKTAAVHYEPRHTTDYILGHTADVRPTSFIEDSGFVQITTSVEEPTTIELSTTLEEDENGPFIEVGNNLGQLVAVVKDSFGNTLEAETVEFTINEPVLGHFGASRTTVTAKTNSDGEAKVWLHAPTIIQDVSTFSISVTHSGDDTILLVPGLQEPDSMEDLVLYKVHLTDDALGWPVSGLDNYYSQYFSEEGIDVDPDTTAATRVYEEDFRERNDLLPPATYTLPTADLKKTLVITQKSGTMNPKTGYIDAAAFSPLYPSEATNIANIQNPQLELTYSDVTLDEMGVGDTLTYFVAGNIKTNIVASVRNRRTNTLVSSAPLFITVKPSSASNGTLFCDTLNDVPSGLLTKVKNIEDLTEAEILSTAGVEGFWDSYIAERQVIKNPSDTKHIVRYRYRKVDNALPTSLTVKLLDGATIIAEWTHANIFTKTEVEQELTEAQILNISNYRDLRLSFFVTDTAPWDDTSLLPSQAEVFSAQLEVEGTSIALENYIGDQIAKPSQDIQRGDWVVDAAPKLRQTARTSPNAAGGSPTEITVTLPENPKNGNALLVSIMLFTKNAPAGYRAEIQNVSAPNVATWVKAHEQSLPDGANNFGVGDGTAGMTEAYYLASNIHNAGSTITVTRELTGIGTDIAGWVVQVMEWEGLSRSDAFADFSRHIEQSSPGTTINTSQAAAHPVDHGLFLARMLSDRNDPVTFSNFSDSDFTEIGSGYTETSGITYDAEYVLTMKTTPASGVAYLEATVPDAGHRFSYADITTWRSAFVESDPLYQELDDMDRELADDLTYIVSPVSGVTPDNDAILSIGHLTDPRSLEHEYEEYVDWFRRTRQGDVVGITNAGEILGDDNIDGLLDVQAMDYPAEIPVGFRVRSAGITIASIIDQITYVDINDHLPEGYYDVQSDIGTLAHEFKVIII